MERLRFSEGKYRSLVIIVHKWRPRASNPRLSNCGLGPYAASLGIILQMCPKKCPTQDHTTNRYQTWDSNLPVQSHVLPRTPSCPPQSLRLASACVSLPWAQSLLLSQILVVGLETRLTFLSSSPWESGSRVCPCCWDTHGTWTDLPQGDKALPSSTECK